MKTQFIYESFNDFVENEIINEAVVNEKIKVTKDEWPYMEFKIGGKKHKVQFDYEDVIDDHGSEGQDQYWIGKDEDGQEWAIDVYADYRGEVQDVLYDTLVKESVVTESITKKDIKVGAEFQVGKDTFKVDEIEKDSKFGDLVRSSRIESTSDKKYSYQDSMEEFVAFLNDEKAKVKK